jgi:hypothetical protein
MSCFIHRRSWRSSASDTGSDRLKTPTFGRDIGRVESGQVVCAGSAACATPVESWNQLREGAKKPRDNIDGLSLALAAPARRCMELDLISVLQSLAERMTNRHRRRRMDQWRA